MQQYAWNLKVFFHIKVAQDKGLNTVWCHLHDILETGETMGVCSMWLHLEDGSN